jgi:hypothetical protein
LGLLDLQDEEAVVVQVDALALEELGDLAEAALASVDVVVGRVVALCCTRDHELRVGHHFVALVVLNSKKVQEWD